MGETENLRRRFSHYRNPGGSQQTNIRMKQVLTGELMGELQGEAEIAVSTVTEQAWIMCNGTEHRANLSNKAVRRLFENFSQVVERDNAITSLNR